MLSLLLSRIKDLTMCEMLVLNNFRFWALLFPVYLLTYYIQLSGSIKPVSLWLRRALNSAFGLRIATLKVPRRVRFYCDLDGVYIMITEYLRGQTSSLVNSTDKVVVDLGAHFAMVTVGIAQKLPISAHVYAIEASPRNYRILLENLRLNSVKNVTTLCLAASDSVGSLELYSEDGGSSHFSAIAAPSGGGHSISVPAYPFEEILQMLGLEHVDLVKIDIEGAELKVLEESIPKVCKNVDKFDIEVHSGSYLQRITHLLEHYGYEVNSTRSGLLSSSYRVIAITT